MLSILTSAIFVTSLSTIDMTQAYAQMQENINTIEAIDANGNNQNATINIKLSKGLAGEPSSSVITNPNRLIIDLPNTLNSLKDLITYNHSLFKDIRITTIDNRSRLVINLNKNITHEIAQNGKLLTVQIKAINNMVANNATNTLNNANNNSMTTTIKGVDFQRSADGAGKIILNLSSRDSVVDIKQQGASLVADFINTKVMDNLKRSYDVNDFATPVKSMRLMPYANGARLQLDPKGAWRYSSYQADDKFIIEVHPIKVDAATQKTALNQTKYSGKKLSLNFQDIDIRSLMQVFGDFTNLNIIVNDNVQGNMTLRLKDVPWDQAFDIVLQSKNLGSKRNGNIIWVAPKDEMLAKEKQELEGKAQIADLEQLKTQTIQLQYHKAEVVFKALMGEDNGGSNARSQPLISKRGSVVIDTRTNQLFVTDIPSKLEEITQLISKIDIPVKQVLIEARIVEANETFGRNLGVKLGTVDLRDPKTRVPGLGIGSDNSLAISGNQSGALQTYGLLPAGDSTSGTGSFRYDVNNTNFVNLPAAAINGFSAAGLGLSLFNKNAQILLNLELSALEAEGKGKIVSSPRILTTDKQKALIEQGTELPYQSATSSGATSVQFKKANLKLEVTPQITPEGKIFLDVDINKDSPSAITNGQAGLAIDTKHVQTQILVDNGGTVMIGGIFEETERKNTTKVPFLGDLPVVGNLFKTTSRSKSRNELLIFLTPKVVEITPYRK